MNIGKAFTEFHFNIILNQDARIYAGLRTALDIFSNKQTVKVFPILIFVFLSYSTLFISHFHCSFTLTIPKEFSKINIY
jgi:hypothetical protein